MGSVTVSGEGAFPIARTSSSDISKPVEDGEGGDINGGPLSWLKPEWTVLMDVNNGCQ